MFRLFRRNNVVIQWLATVVDLDLHVRIALMQVGFQLLSHSSVRILATIEGDQFRLVSIMESRSVRMVST